MVVSAKRSNLKGLSKTLVDAGLLAEKDAQDANRRSVVDEVPLPLYLMQQNMIDSDKLLQAMLEQYKIPLFDVNTIEISNDLFVKVKEKTLKQNWMVPFYARGDLVYVATVDPSNVGGLDALRNSLRKNTQAILVEPEKLKRLMDSALDILEMHQALSKEPADDDEGRQVQSAAFSVEQTDSQPAAVRLVNKMLVDCLRDGASDIHIEPYEKYFRVRFRIDGVLQEVRRPPSRLAGKIVSRIKVMSRMDVSEKRVPQDGRIKIRISKSKTIDYRVNTCPTLFGEKVVMRILDSDMSIPLDELGYEKDQLGIFMRNLHKPYGMFLVTGPTGSGKTVSLYSGINLINTPDINISTAEDPVEINLAGVNQVQIDERTGMTFEKALKAFLRQDPDIILVGEIRDITTGNIAIKAAQTGHMVMSTLHTNDAPQTLTRMVDMGLKPFAIATAVNIVTAQRLARRLHSACRKEISVPNSALLKEGFTQRDLDRGFTIYGPGSCGVCNGGYKGRVGVYQVMEISDEMRRLIMDGKNAIDLADRALSEGIRDIRQSALLKVSKGFTSIDEMNRITQD